MLLAAARWARRRWYVVVPVVVLVAAAIVYLTYGQRPGDVLNKNVPFTAPTTQPPTPKPKPKTKQVQLVNWPLYGYDLQRTHYLPGADAKNVKIITRNGVVTLRGPVDSQAEKDFIANAARSTAGVASVDDQTEVAAKSGS